MFPDEYRDADTRQGSYFDTHNIDPAVVDSSQFGLLWNVPFNDREKCAWALQVVQDKSLTCMPSLRQTASLHPKRWQTAHPPCFIAELHQNTGRNNWQSA